MTDHYPSIRARHMRVVNARAILIWLACFAVFLAVVAIAVDGWQRYKKREQHYAELFAEHEAMVRCINGLPIGIDTAVMRCTLREIKLLKPNGGKS